MVEWLPRNASRRCSPLPSLEEGDDIDLVLPQLGISFAR
jgi:hypothetical protein